MRETAYRRLFMHAAGPSSPLPVSCRRLNGLLCFILWPLHSHAEWGGLVCLDCADPEMPLPGNRLGLAIGSVVLGCMCVMIKRQSLTPAHNGADDSCCCLLAGSQPDARGRLPVYGRSSTQVWRRSRGGEPSIGRSPDPTALAPQCHYYHMGEESWWASQVAGYSARPKCWLKCLQLT